MDNNVKFYSEIERYEIININDGEKYNCVGNNDVIIDEQGNFKYIILNKNYNKFKIFNNNEFIEVPWECVRKIGSKTVIIDADEQVLKKSKL